MPENIQKLGKIVLLKNLKERNKEIIQDVKYWLVLYLLNKYNV